MGEFKYTNGQTPQGYSCSECGAVGCKLWRQYQTLADHINLLCVDCAMEDQGVDYEVDEEGYHHEDICRRCLPIEWLVPAVPTEDNETFWGYTSVPSDGVDWWKRLPLRIDKE